MTHKMQQSQSQAEAHTTVKETTQLPQLTPGHMMKSDGHEVDDPHVNVGQKMKRKIIRKNLKKDERKSKR